jgi:peptide/nickel transport system ATP-binding protein/oligopeptide transport system ATP-binding protein
MSTLLAVRGLTKHFPVRSGVMRRQSGLVRAVDGLDFDVAPGETFGLVGESGCGKTTTGRLVTRLLEPSAGRVWLDGREITALRGRKLRPVRREIALIFQDPYSSLNPRHTVGTIVGAPFRLQGIATPHGTRAAVQQLLELVGLNPEHYNRYPHEFSGGQRQRIGIARALALRPRLVVADEPVSALDVSIQAQVLNLLEDLQAELGLAYVVIAHDLAVVRHLCDRIGVMYLGRLVEVGTATELYARPRHPYTVALLAAAPQPDPARRLHRPGVRLTGEPPSPLNPPPGCPFHPRCPKVRDVCRVTPPVLTADTAGHAAACHFPENADERLTRSGP